MARVSLMMLSWLRSPWPTVATCLWFVGRDFKPMILDDALVEIRCGPESICADGKPMQIRRMGPTGRPGTGRGPGDGAS